MNSAILKSRIDEASTILKSYFDFKESDKTVEVIITALQKIGIDDSELGFKILEAESTTVADFAQAFRGMGYDLPEPRIKVAWLILKGQDPFEQKEVNLTPHSPDLVKAVVEQLERQKPIGQWSDTDLLEQYSKHCPMKIEEELAKRSKGRPVIIFEQDGTVNLPVSLILLRQARHQDTPSMYIVDGESSGMRQVYKVGDFPMNVLYECPVHANVLLTEGYCEECGLKWVDFEANKDKYIFLRLVSETTRIEPVVLRMYLTQSFEDLVKLYPKVLMKYNTLKEEEKLPTLKRRISKSKNGDPFRVVHTTY